MWILGGSINGGNVRAFRWITLPPPELLPFPTVLLSEFLPCPLLSSPSLLSCQPMPLLTGSERIDGLVPISSAGAAAIEPADDVHRALRRLGVIPRRLKLHRRYPSMGHSKHDPEKCTE